MSCPNASNTTPNIRRITRERDWSGEKVLAVRASVSPVRRKDEAGASPERVPRSPHAARDGGPHAQHAAVVSFQRLRLIVGISFDTRSPAPKSKSATGCGLQGLAG